MLLRAGYAAKAVVRVAPDEILWVDKFDRAHTSYIEAREKNGAWVCRVVTTVPGFPA